MCVNTKLVGVKTTELNLFYVSGDMARGKGQKLKNTSHI